MEICPDEEYVISTTPAWVLFTSHGRPLSWSRFCSPDDVGFCGPDDVSELASFQEMAVSLRLP
jgi:hypothetical protein